jgi:Zn-dependent protease with chaperone function
LLIAAVGRPRFGRESTPRVERAKTPALVTVIDEIAMALDTRPPDVIRVDATFNASASPAGLRSRVLTVGAPMWAALSPQSRVALLTHELGHFAHRDVLHGRYVWVAYQTLAAWEETFTPAYGLVSTRGHRPILATVLTWPLRMLIRSYLRVFSWVGAASKRRQELYADLAAVEVAGSAGTVDMLERMLLEDIAEVAANRAAVDPARPDLSAAISERMRTITDTERAWARTQGATERSSVDSTHPPTIDRIRLIESIPPSPPGLVLDDTRARAIDAELAPYLDRAFKELGDAYRYVT